eukprot:Hpha_TRINITY_DN27562_c0_g1::TRINITY_DN27562_c0_g1_i1::g.86224::m.86224
MATEPAGGLPDDGEDETATAGHQFMSQHWRGGTVCHPHVVWRTQLRSSFMWVPGMPRLLRVRQVDELTAMGEAAQSAIEAHPVEQPFECAACGLVRLNK